MKYAVKIICLMIFYIYAIDTYSKSIETINKNIINAVKKNNEHVAQKLFYKLIKKSKLKGNAYFRIANYYAQIDSITRSEKYYKLAIQKSPYYYYITNNNELNKVYYSQVGETDYLSKYDSLNKQTIDSFYQLEIRKRKWIVDTGLLQKLISIKQTDDPIRKKMSQAYANKDSVLFRSLFDSLKKIQPYYDSINYLRVDSLIKRYGWLDFSNIGYEGATVFWTVLQHIPNKYKEQYLSKYKRSAFNGNSSIGKYTNFLDRFLFFNKKKCMYAPQPYSKTASTDPNEMEYSKMKYPKRTNIRRLKIGLPILQK